MHVPVMLAECLEYLNIQPDGVYLDLTAGLGGHTGAIARRLTTGLVIACDRDAESIELARAEYGGLRGAHPVSSGFVFAGGRDAGGRKNKTTGRAASGFRCFEVSVDRRREGLLADGGRSFGHAHVAHRIGQERTAAEIVNFESEKELAGLIFSLGGERRSRKIARAIVRARPIQTTGQLAKLIEGVVPRTGKLHPATQTFMALRLAVNQRDGRVGGSARSNSAVAAEGRKSGDPYVYVA